jgi:hypothetical protein
MRLFDVICGLYHAHAYESLVLSHIQTEPVGEGDGVGEAGAKEVECADDEDGDCECTFHPILNSFPASLTNDRSSGSSLDCYTLHARGISAQVASMHASLGVPPDNKRKWNTFDNQRGPFLDALFAKLRQFPSLSLKECLLVTSVVSRVLKYPSRALYECAAHAALEAVALVSAESELYASKLKMEKEDLKAALNKANVTLSSLRDFELTTNQDEVALFFQKTVVLDEFVRELVAIDSARQVFAIESQE